MCVLGTTIIYKVKSLKRLWLWDLGLKGFEVYPFLLQVMAFRAKRPWSVVRAVAKRSVPLPRG